MRRSPNFVPALKRPVCKCVVVQGLGALEEPIRVVVGLVSRFLKVPECLGYSPEARVYREAGEGRGKFVGRSASGEGLAEVLHVRVVECARQALTNGIATLARYHHSRGFVDEAVKKRVLRRGYGAAKAGLGRASRFLGSQMICLLEEVGMQAHVRSSVSVCVLKLT